MNTGVAMAFTLPAGSGFLVVAANFQVLHLNLYVLVS